MRKKLVLVVDSTVPGAVQEVQFKKNLYRFHHCQFWVFESKLYPSWQNSDVKGAIYIAFLDFICPELKGLGHEIEFKYFYKTGYF